MPYRRVVSTQRVFQAASSSFKVRIPVLSFLVLLCALWLGCSGSDNRPSNARAAAPQIVPVGVSTAKKTDTPVFLTGLGSVQAFNTVSVKTRVDGQLVQVAFREGQHVNKGDLLAVVDPRPYQVALSQAQAQLFKDQASLRDAQLNYERFKGLLQDSGAMSQQQVDTQRATAEQLEGAVRSDQATVENAKLNLAYCHITSPITGRVGLRMVDIGNMVHASDTNPLLIITQLQPIAVLFTLPEDKLLAVKKHMTGHPLMVDAYGRDDQTKIESGSLVTIDNQIDPTTGTAKLKAVFDNKGETLWPNQFVNVHLLLETLKNSIVVPAAAIQRGPQGTFVYGVKPDKTVEIRPVTVALTQSNTSVISSGVAPGDMVVTDGQDKLQAGTKVEPRIGGVAPSAAGPGISNPQNQNATSGAQ
ncbi:MAG TPA: MdtA/MuxA family multidrug efflux RND transporter periplasmic adaptor subunit [Terriglobales bacterium]|nr:MdtA/MuxA family multidrug efflux RND transporter periplasmic adaptor subunit [Terriglobales bacterium]